MGGSFWSQWSFSCLIPASDAMTQSQLVLSAPVMPGSHQEMPPMARDIPLEEWDEWMGEVGRHSGVH